MPLPGDDGHHDHADDGRHDHADDGRHHDADDCNHYGAPAALVIALVVVMLTVVVFIVQKMWPFVALCKKIQFTSMEMLNLKHELSVNRVNM